MPYRKIGTDDWKIGFTHEKIGVKEGVTVLPITHTPITVVKIILDYCENVFGSAPCEAEGTPCYNTFPTCRDRLNFGRVTKEYLFSSADTPLPFSGPRPYVLEVNYIPTEIKDNFTISGRVNITFTDEPDGDRGIDPYISERAQSAEGTFWKKLITRNKNYKGRLVEVYEGFLGWDFEEYQKKFVGRIENISINGAEVTIEVADLLRTLADVEVPQRIDCRLVIDITPTITKITLTDVSQLDDSGYVRISDEIIGYGTKNEVTNQILDCERGAFDTVPAEHKAKDKVGKVRFYPAANPFDILREMLTVDAELDAEFINTGEFEYWRDYPATDINFSGLITEPTKLSQLYFEIVDLLDCKSWIAEDWKISIRRNLPNHPQREYGTLTDALNIIDESAEVDLNESSRFTRVLLYWNKTTLGKVDDAVEYARLDMAVEADAESENGYGETIQKKFLCRWLKTGLAQEELIELYIRNFLARRIFRTRDAAGLLYCVVDIKDSAMHTGSWVRVTTNEFLKEDGQDYTNIAFQIIKREKEGEKIKLSLLKLLPRRLCFITPGDFPDYADASLSQREYGFICGADGKMSNGDEGYYIY
ncbi:MAG: hypothetical protein KKH94_11335 [Candidatus Omnitrophica bacterium]|nr:hypothetical protein [Candidatus Omnitrophota bacterium]